MPGLTAEDVEVVIQQVVDHMYVLVTHPALEDVQVQAVANLIWACGRLQTPIGQTELEAMLRALTHPRLLGDANALDTIQVFEGLAQLHSNSGWEPKMSPQLWQSLLGDEVLGKLLFNRILGFFGSDIADTLLCVVTLVKAGDLQLGVAQQSVMRLLQRVAPDKLKYVKAQNVDDILRACAALGLTTDDMEWFCTSGKKASPTVS